MAHVSAAERRPQLIKAAIDLMTREGVAAGSTRAIAAELGVAQATVHYTFGTKEDLYRAVMEQLTHDPVGQVAKWAPTDSGFEETAASLAAALWRTVTAVTAKLVSEAAERAGHRLAQPPETIARFFLAGFDGLTMPHLSLPDEQAEPTCLQALVSAVVALAGGRVDLVPVPTA
ncbi:TetR/AcrR family transcriptional regulator [Streptomyces sp. NPDC001617]